MTPGPKKEPKNDPDSLRSGAEKKLGRKPKDTPAIAGTTPEQIIHELQVHQIELEMQNEALRESRLELEETRDRYLDLYEFAPVGYLTLTKAAAVEEANLTMASLLGMDRKKLVKGRFRSLVAPEDHDAWDRYFIAVLRSGEKQSCELQLLKWDDSRFHGRLEGMRIDREDKDPVIRVAISDISRQVLAEEQLRYDALILNEVQDAIITTKNDEGFTITNWNPGAEKIYGWKREEVLGKKAGILKNRYPGRERQDVLRAIFKTGLFEGELIQTRKDGTEIIISGQLMARRDTKGRITDFISISQDITDRKLAEDVINRLSEERRILIDNMPAMIWYKDTKNNFVRVNPAGARTFGAPVRNIEGKSAYDLFPEDADDYYRDDLEVISSGQPKYGIIQPMKTAGGQNLWIRTDKIPLKDQKGTITGLLVFAVDITEIKLAEEELVRRSDDISAVNVKLTASGDELKQNEERLKQSLEEKEVLLAEIHHRVKNNLAAFISLLALDGTYEESEAGQRLKKDLQNRARSMALIHETLYRTRNFSSVDMDLYLSTLSEQVAGTFRSERSVRIIVDAEGISLDLIRATPSGLIVNELITNVFKYAFPPSFDCETTRHEPCTLWISLSLSNGSYLLSVRDNGVGLPAAFDPLTAKSLGLKLVKFLARHQLRAQTEVFRKNGTEFRFRFKEQT
jgi:PAS domain S-box-containing protein